MQYMIGAVFTVFFVACLGLSYLLGYKQGKALKPRTKAVPVDEAERLKAERLQKEFEIISGYNLSKAAERKVNS